MMGRRCSAGRDMEPWYFGMSFAGSQYMDGLEGWGDGWVGVRCPSWRTSCSLVGCVLQGVTLSDL